MAENGFRTNGSKGFQTQKKEKKFNVSAAANGLPLDENKQEKEITPDIIEAAKEADDTNKINGTEGGTIHENNNASSNVFEDDDSSEDRDKALLAKIKSLAGGLYPNSENPEDDLIKELEEENAGKRGMNPEDFRRSEEDRRDAEEYRKLRKRQQEYEDGRQKILDRWKRDTERLKREVPEFDLDTAMKNDEFRELVINGTSIDGAYYAVRYHELNGTAPRRAIMQNASGRGMKPGSGMNDLTSLDDREFKREIKKLIDM